MTKKNLLVIDIDGTVTDIATSYQKVFIKSLKELGVIEMDKNFGAYKHLTDTYIAKLIFEKDRKIDFTDAIKYQFEDLLLDNMQYYETGAIKGVQQKLKTIESSTDFGICFATGSMYKPATYKLDKIGIPFLPKQLVAANDFTSREEIVTQAINNAKDIYAVDTFERIISVGDGLWDKTTAENLNLEFYGMGLHKRDLLLEHGTSPCYKDWKEFEIVG